MRMNGKLQTVIVIEIVILYTIASFFIPGGDDLYHYYLPFAAGDTSAGFVPYHAQFILAPLTWIPLRFLWPAWVLVSLVLLLWACRRLGGNPFVLLFSFPLLGQLWLGQVDALIAAGLALALTAKNSYLVGAGLVLASIKPQVAGVSILLILWQKRREWRIWAVPVLVLAFSLAVFGPDWPLRWLLSGNRPAHHSWSFSSLFPWGLAAFAAVLLLRGEQEQVRGSLIASAIGAPSFSVYSHVLLLLFDAPWWVVPLSFAWLLIHPAMGDDAVVFASIVPIILLALALKNHKTPGRFSFSNRDLL